MGNRKRTWVILLRGINVGGVKVLMADLKQMLEDVGMENVKTLLASGNVIADAEMDEHGAVKRVVEEALAKTFGRPLSVIVRSHEEIRQIVAENPFAGVELTDRTRLNVSFLGAKAKEGLPVPYTSEDGSFQILVNKADALYSVLDLDKTGTVDAMAIIEKAWGKDVTTRAWNTVEKIAAAR